MAGILVPFAVFSFEAAVVPSTRDQSWSLLSNYLLFLYMGGGFVLSFLVYKLLNLDSFNTKISLTSTIIMGIGKSNIPIPTLQVQILMYATWLGAIFLTDFSGNDDLPTWQLFVSSILFVIGFSIGSTQISYLIASYLSHQVDTDVGARTNLFFGVVSLANFAGPIWGAAAFDLSGLNLVAHTIAATLSVALLSGFLGLTRSTLSDPGRAPLVNKNEPILLGSS